MERACNYPGAQNDDKAGFSRAWKRTQWEQDCVEAFNRYDYQALDRNREGRVHEEIIKLTQGRAKTASNQPTLSAPKYLGDQSRVNGCREKQVGRCHVRDEVVDGDSHVLCRIEDHQDEAIAQDGHSYDQTVRQCFEIFRGFGINLFLAGLSGVRSVVHGFSVNDDNLLPEPRLIYTISDTCLMWASTCSESLNFNQREPFSFLKAVLYMAYYEMQTAQVGEN